MAMKMSKRLIENQSNMVLNLSLSLVFLLAKAEPMVSTTTAKSIIKLCKSPKKLKSNFQTVSLKLAKKYWIKGL